MRRIGVLFLMVLGFVFIASGVYAEKKIIVFHAGSLSVPFSKMARAFEQKYPSYIVVREASGSRTAARKIADLHKPCDVMASADYSVINNLLIATHNAKFNILFATNEMAIVFTNGSKYANVINSRNWPEILLKKGVVVGHSNPNDDPCGYRAMLVAQLAEKYYHIKGFFKKLFGYPGYYRPGFEKRGKIVVRPKETDLLALLQMHDVDYIFLYKSVAIQHHLRYIQLPPQVSLGSKRYESFYKTVSFRVTGKKPGEYIVKRGAPMVYGITIPQNANSPVDPEGARLFVKFVISPEGQKIMRECGQGVINPPVIIGDDSILK